MKNKNIYNAPELNVSEVHDNFLLCSGEIRDEFETTEDVFN